MLKHPERSNILTNYLNTFKYELVDQQIVMSTNFTYQMIRKKKSDDIEIIRSFKDHVAASIDCTNITHIDVYDETGNNSDHNLILFKNNLNTNNKMEEMYTKPKLIKKTFNWSDKEFVENYRQIAHIE